MEERARVKLMEDHIGVWPDEVSDE
jgi:hypothetical protein